jgi:hypothetical protein
MVLIAAHSRAAKGEGNPQNKILVNLRRRIC